MHRSIARLIPAAPLLLAGCFGLSDEEENLLVVHQQNSKLYYDRGDLARAEHAARSGLEIDDENETLQLTLAYILLQNGSEDALIEADDLLDDLQGWGGTDDFRIALGRGVAHQGMFRHASAADRPDEAERRFIDARNHFERAFDLQPDCTEAVFHLALLDLEAENFAAFDTHSEQTLRLVSLSLRAKNTQLERVDQPGPRAAILRDRATDIQRGQQILRLRAGIAYREGRTSDAVAELDRLETMEAFRPADHFDRAEMLVLSGDYERASSDYERFIELSSGGVDANVERAIEELQRLRAELAQQRVESDGSSAEG